MGRQQQQQQLAGWKGSQHRRCSCTCLSHTRGHTPVAPSCYQRIMYPASCVLLMLLPSKRPKNPETSNPLPPAAAQSWQAEAAGAASARAASRRLGDLDDLLEGLYEEDLGARGAAAGRIALLFRDLNNFEVQWGRGGSVYVGGGARGREEGGTCVTSRSVVVCMGGGGRALMALLATLSLFTCKTPPSD